MSTAIVNQFLQEEQTFLANEFSKKFIIVLQNVIEWAFSMWYN